MENAEEVMQLLEEFSKIKPKEIPRELEDYLGYVAKTGDPVYQWSLVKNLFREKLLSVITDFYETTLTVELPPCPNVDPFNYERMKTSLLERFDTFSSAPFTVQRICELLTNPRKEYNRADKYMRAIEKNILVVSTREPGTGKRPLECDSQSETVLNGIPDMKLNESDGSFLHVPTDLPYLGAPPASNDVTVETTEPNSTINDKLNLSLDNDGDSKTLKSECGKSWTTEESPVLVRESELTNTSSDTLNEEVTLNIEGKGPQDDNCDTNDRLTDVENRPLSANVSPNNFEGETSTDMFQQNSETVLPDTGSIDSLHECSEIPPPPNATSKLENEEEGMPSDENEVSSTPADASEDVPLIQEEPEEPTDSEAEATHKSLSQHAESDIDLDSLPDSEINSSDLVVQTDDEKTVTVSEVTETKSDEVDLECNEISGTIGSPISPGNNASLHADDLVDQNVGLNELDECEDSDLHPDSSNDVCLQNEGKSVPVESLSLQKPESCVEADSMSETNINLAELQRKNNLEEGAPDQTDELSLHGVENNTQVSSPGVTNITGDGSLDKNPEDSELSSSSQEETVVSNSLIQDNVKLAEIQSTSEVAEEMFDQERREGSVIHSVSNVPDSQQHLSTIEEISVDPSCEAEEAMDVDDSSNQMMISEGENEGEPMDQCDQLQS